jgi:serine/threonine protein kinase
MSEERTREALADAFLLAKAMDSITDQQSRMHLVHIYDAGIAKELDDRWFLTMEFVAGVTLEDRFTSFGKVPASQLTRWVAQVCLALRGLHRLARPLLHRDLKPSNVLLGTDRVVRLVDFGLAAEMVQLGHIPGTVGVLDHMSPETATGKSSPASDIYSLGVLAYEGLTGELPFRRLVPPADVPDAIHGEWLFEQKKLYRVVPPSRVNNSVSARLDEIILTCLAHDPNQRFADAGELYDALHELGTDTTRPADRAREECRERCAAGDAAGALRAVENALAQGELTRDERFWLTRDKGEVFDQLGDPAAAAKAFVEAWQLTEHTALLRTSKERAELLDRVIASFLAAGNSFQADRYTRRRDAELGGGA